MSVEFRSREYELLPNGLTRQSLPIDQWPWDLRAKWETYCALCEVENEDLLADFVECATPAERALQSCRKSHIAESSCSITENIAGRWLLFAEHQNAAVLPTPETYKSWIQSEKARGLAATTIGTGAYRLWRFCIVVWPDCDWHWMGKVWQPMKKLAKPMKDKRPRLRNANAIEVLGFDLMNDAVQAYEARRHHQQAAVQYRDGLMLAMWSQKPLRLADMTALVFSDFETLADGRIKVEIARTKNNDPDEATYDEDIAAALEDWRDVFRPLLKPPADNDRIWIGRLGAPMLSGGLYQACTYRTQKAFGVSINPHLMRDCVARTIAEHSPEAAHAIGNLLGHRDQRSAKHYLGQSMMIGGGVKLDEIWDEYRVPPPLRRRSQE